MVSAYNKFLFQPESPVILDFQQITKIECHQESRGFESTLDLTRGFEGTLGVTHDSSRMDWITSASRHLTDHMTGHMIPAGAQRVRDGNLNPREKTG